MNTTSDEEIYWSAVDDFIQLANDKSQDGDVGIVSSAMLNATARYLAFYLASNAESRKDLKEDKETLIQDISREFKKNFADNLEDYIENYKVYLAEAEEE